MPRPSRVGVPSAAVKLPSEPPPVRGTSWELETKTARQHPGMLQQLGHAFGPLEGRPVHATRDGHAHVRIVGLQGVDRQLEFLLRPPR